ncbi:histidine phosphatase family protein [Marinactinospora thermotolerans]|uniref:8-oxo-dGTP diphosphatase n=1 Tax=Marinactinospora thermotolerans DSM 45154 TaxID=1122192 RepID=A0A1T4TB35_9ACTN|nr:histidine phosphatase family protein [Marinactinospora thermotolerans]SKA37419.1 8-oxo-dGTP diphosphatase [Marinactinospora thermotolerans DSM 45154]
MGDPRGSAVAGTASRPSPAREVGAVLWRPGAAEREVALVRRPGRGGWALPRGASGRHEHPLTAVARVLAEQAGVRPVLGPRLSPAVSLGRSAPVRWWSAAAPPARPTVVGRGGEAVWTPLTAARDRVTAAEREVLADLAARPSATVPVILLRHASAGDKRAWDGDDLRRPLDDTGRDDARRLAEVLETFGAPPVVTSTASRCVETVRPYQARTAATVRGEPAFTVGTGDARDPFDRAAARAAFAALLARRTPVLVCTHGELVPDLVAEATAGTTPPADPELAKGAFWVVHLPAAGGGLAGLERYGPRE